MHLYHLQFNRLVKHIHMQSTCRIRYRRLWLWEDTTVETEDYKHIMECRRMGSRKKRQRSIMRRRRGGGGDYKTVEMLTVVKSTYQY